MSIKVLSIISFLLFILACSMPNRNYIYKTNDVFNEFGFSRSSSQDFVKDIFLNQKELKLEYESSSSPFSYLSFTGGKYWNLPVDNWVLLFNHFSISRLTITFSNETNIDSTWNYLNNRLDELYKWKAFRTDSTSLESSWVQLSIWEPRTCRNYYSIGLKRNFDDNNIEQIKLIYYNTFNKPEL